MFDNPQMLAARAQQAMREGRFEEALEDLAILRKKLPTDATIPLNMAYVNRALGNVDAAKSSFEDALVLSPNDIGLRGQYASWLDDIGEFDAAIVHYDEILKRDPRHLDALIDRALAMAKGKRRAEGISELEKICKMNGNALRAWLNLAVLKREDGAYAEAERAAEHVLEHHPDHPRASQILAVCAYDQGKPSVALLERAATLNPDKLQITANLAAALLAEDRATEALELLDRTLEGNPLWIEGHSALAAFRWQLEGDGKFGESFERARRQHPDVPDLWNQQIVLTSRTLGHESALELIDRARATTGMDAEFDLLEANSRFELGDLAKADAIFGRIDREANPDARFTFLRFLIKAHRFQEAVTEGLKLVDLGAGADAWPFVGIAWRMLDDNRWGWLEGDHDLAKSYELQGLDIGIARIADELRRLHKFNHQPIEQSLRGGTQTEAMLFTRQSPEIRQLVASISQAVQEYVDTLPSPVPDHPLLGQPRDQFRFSGSWSVRLTDAGFHVQHIHNRGVISSAAYIALPETMGVGGDSQEGWLVLGEPPAELKTGLPPTRLIEPKVGRLALFPSTMWHGTRPFGKGERLTCAFDVQLT